MHCLDGDYELESLEKDEAYNEFGDMNFCSSDSKCELGEGDCDR